MDQCSNNKKYELFSEIVTGFNSRDQIIITFFLFSYELRLTWQWLEGYNERNLNDKGIVNVLLRKYVMRYFNNDLFHVQKQCNAPLSRVSKQNLKQLCRIWLTLSLDKRTPAGQSTSIRRTCRASQGPIRILSSGFSTAPSSRGGAYHQDLHQDDFVVAWIGADKFCMVQRVGNAFDGDGCRFVARI